jgi:hypothetical protein
MNRSDLADLVGNVDRGAITLAWMACELGRGITARLDARDSANGRLGREYLDASIDRQCSFLIMRTLRLVEA